MNILFLNHFAGIPQKSDKALRHFNIAKELQKKYNYKCSIITSSQSYLSDQKVNIDKQKIKGIDYYFIDEFSTNKNNLFIKLIRMFSFSLNLFWYFKKNPNKHNPDIIFASSPTLLSCLAAYYFSKKTRAKFIFEIRDIWPLSQVDLHNFSYKHPMIFILKKIEILLHKKSYKVVSNLPYYHNYLNKYKINVNDYIYLPQYIDINYYDKNYIDCDILNEHQEILQSYDKVCIYAGTIGSFYGISYIIDSINTFNSNNNKKIALILIGDGDYKTIAEDYLEKNKINDIFIFDTVSKSYLFSLMKKCSFSILSLPDNETHEYGIASLKSIDYLYAGIPILMIGPFKQYSILRKSSYQFNAEFGNISEMLNEYHKLSNLDISKKERIKRDYHNILENHCSARTVKKELKEIFI